uniref:Pterin-binding domain-containing protein n=1 Tax=Picea sitchensis TaxID=3332 RepID=B8LNJ1_PICSI|nr:unknown [Picea sitchensis]
MTWVCGTGVGISLPTLHTNSRPISSPRTRSSTPHQIRCKTTNRNPPSPPIPSIPRRQVIPLMGLSLLLNLSGPAQAKDIPIFGIKKMKVEEAVEKAKELVKEGEQEVEIVAETVKETAENLEKIAALEGPGPVVQAGVVAGAEVIGVLVASSVVNGIVRT